jgi:hypothetical protein
MKKTHNKERGFTLTNYGALPSYEVVTVKVLSIPILRIT